MGHSLNFFSSTSSLMLIPFGSTQDIFLPPVSVDVGELFLGILI